MYRVLTLDGGGVKGLISATILKRMQEAMDGIPLTKMFDFVIGTSTGGIIALAIGMPDNNRNPKFEAEDMVNLYLEKADDIFYRNHFDRIKQGIFSSKYDRENIDEILNEYFGGVELKDTLIPVGVTTYSIKDHAPKTWTTFKAQQLDKKMKCTPENAKLKDIAGATSAAPTFFDPKIFYDSCGRLREEVDGGIHANNPQIAAIASLKAQINEFGLSNIMIVSIGTGEIIDKEPIDSDNGGAFEWLTSSTNIIEMMMDGASDLNSEATSALFDNYYRLQVPITKSISKMDNASPKNLQDLIRATEKYLAHNQSYFDEVVNALKNATNLITMDNYENAELYPSSYDEVFEEAV